MSTPIFNREFQHPADGWYQIEAKGEHPNSGAGVVQVIDDTAVKSIVDSFNADAKAGTLRHGHEMLVDIEHFKDQPDKETRAYGWLQELQNRADGIYGRIHWTATGQAAVDGGDYRFFSTEYDRKDCKILNGSDPKRIRPMKLDGLTLTNMNNNRGQKAITNRDAARAVAGTRESDADTQAKAAWLFNQLAYLEQKRTNGAASIAWATVRNREPALYSLAQGKHPVETMLAVCPGLDKRLRLYNRALENVTDSTAKAAKAVAPEALGYLQHRLETIRDDIGASLADKDASERTIWFTFVAQVKRAMRENGLTCEQAFNKLKDEQNLFWTQAMLSFEPATET